MAERFGNLLPLVIFTTLIPTAAGVSAAQALSLVLEGDHFRPGPLLLLTPTVLAAVGLFVSLAHLAHVWRFPLAALGLGRSWLSAEAALAVLFAAAAAVAALAVDAYPDGDLGIWLSIVAGILGLAACVAIGFVYILPGQVGWGGVANFATTPFSAAYMAVLVVSSSGRLPAGAWTFYSFVFFDLVLAAWRYRRFDRIAGDGRALTYANLKPPALTVHNLRVLAAAFLYPLLFHQAPAALPWLYAPAIFADRFTFYSIAARVSPRVEVARVKAQRMKEAVARVGQST